MPMMTAVKLQSLATCSIIAPTKKDTLGSCQVPLSDFKAFFRRTWKRQMVKNSIYP
jgi:hypothetical protein